MGSADDFRLGDWNIRCDRCGRKLKGSQARKTWNNLYVCAEHWEPRHPQDFVRSIPEHPAPPFVRDPPDVFLNLCDGIVMEDSTTSVLFNPGQDIDYILTEDGPWFITEN